MKIAATLVLFLFLVGARHVDRTPVADRMISLESNGVTIVQLLSMLGSAGRENIVADASVPNRIVSVRLHSVPFSRALQVIMSANGLSEHWIGNVLLVGSTEAMAQRFPGDGDPLESTTQSVTLERANALDVRTELLPILSPDLLIIADSRNARIIVSGSRSSVSRAVELIAILDEPGDSASSRSYSLRYVRASDAKSELALLVPKALVVVDDMHNALLIGGDAQLVRQARGFLTTIDRPSPQVLFEVRVADITPINDQSNFGLEFGGLDFGGQQVPGATTYSFAGGSIPVNVKLNAMLSEGRARILATPKILTVSDHVAKLHIGATYPIATNGSVFGSQSVQYIDIGVKLEIRATIERNGSVIADIHPQYSEILGFTAQNFPIIANRRIDSTLRVRNGETIVLGGLLQDVSSETIERIPGLSRIPILGGFFANKATHHERDEIVFLITPHVIEPNATPPSK